MAWRPPRTVLLFNTLVSVVQVSAEEMKDAVEDHEGAKGAWDVDSKTIYLLKSLSPRGKNDAYSHELGHALLDLADTR